MKITLQMMVRNQLNRMHDQDALVDYDGSGYAVVKNVGVGGSYYTIWCGGKVEIADASIDEAVEWICE